MLFGTRAPFTLMVVSLILFISVPSSLCSSLIQSYSKPVSGVPNDLISRHSTVQINTHGSTDISLSSKQGLHQYQLGDTEVFSIDTKTNFSATCSLIGQDVYIFQDQRISVSLSIEEISNTITANITPLLNSYFGPIPDFDYNGRFILVLTDLPSGLIAFFDPVDLTWSGFQGEIIYVDAYEFSYEALVHELQHLLHFVADSFEEIWLNEGFSVYAEYLYRKDLSSSELLEKIQYPQGTSLIYWDNSPNRVTSYDCVRGFMYYLMEKFGHTILRQIYYAEKAGVPLHGLESILYTLQENSLHYSASELFQEWQIAMHLGNSSNALNRTWLFDNFTVVPSLYVFPSDNFWGNDYPYQEHHSILPMASISFYFHDFPDGNQINVILTSSKIDEKLSLNLSSTLIKVYNNNEYIIEDYYLDQKGVLSINLNQTQDKFLGFYLVVYLSGLLEGGYLNDIPEIAKGINFELRIEAGQRDRIFLPIMLLALLGVVVMGFLAVKGTKRLMRVE